MIFGDKKQVYKFLMENWEHNFVAEIINIKFVINKNKIIKNHGLKWFYDGNNKAQAYIYGKLYILILFIINHYINKKSIVDALKYINNKNVFDIINTFKNRKLENYVSKNANDKINKKGKEEMVKKTLSKIEKTFNLLKDGKKVNVATIAKKNYGDSSIYSLKKARTIISDLRKKGYDINLISKNIYQLSKSIYQLKKIFMS